MLDRVYDRSSCEIEDILQHPKFDKQDVEILGELVDIIKDIEMVYDYQNNMNGYSQMNGMMGRSGRYMRGRSMTNYPQDNNRDMLLEHLTNVANMAVNEKDRKAIERLMSQMSEQ